MVGRLLSFWDGLFSGAMLNFVGLSLGKSLLGTLALGDRRAFPNVNSSFEFIRVGFYMWAPLKVSLLAGDLRIAMFGNIVPYALILQPLRSWCIGVIFGSDRYQLDLPPSSVGIR